SCTPSTSVTKEALPIIRYRTRDLTRLLPGTAQPAMRRMERITGRSDDLIILRGVNVFPTQVEELVLRADGLSPHFQITLSRRGRMDHMTITAEAAEDCAPGLRAAAPESLARAVKDAIGITAEVVVADPGTLERSVGKLRRVLDRRGA
ncbi:phenylacetate--CoA ligase, partial [Saccharopolyspora sp. NPDC047091]